MRPLASAHRGYEYQDLLLACRFVDVILESIKVLHVDEKVTSPVDVFDDLTTLDRDDCRERIQIKHTDHPNRPLNLSAFTTKSGLLRLDHVLSTALQDRDGPGCKAKNSTFRIVLRHEAPTDSRLLKLLVPADPDPGPLVQGMNSLRMAFRAKDLWQEYTRLAKSEPVSHSDLTWVCDRLVLEFHAPAASLDLSEPGEAEELLLRRIREEVGVGIYPNERRADLDVADALVSSARAARHGSLIATRAALLRRAALRVNYGAVLRSDPVDPAQEVPRPAAVEQVIDRATAAACEGETLLLVGPPGQGKSWTCAQVIRGLSERGWLVAEHYCYLGDRDQERLLRAQENALFGSLMKRLGEHHPEILAQQRPRFSVSRHALEDAIRTITQREPSNPVALVIDGLDHVSRLISHRVAVDPSYALAETLGELSLPSKSVLIVLSQPGEHLEPLRAKGASTFRVPKLTEPELLELARRFDLPEDRRAHNLPGPGSSSQRAAKRRRKFVATLAAKSAGNALYATYLCREARRNPATLADPEAAIRSLPQYDHSLRSYYQHLRTSLGDHGGWVADVLALVDFPLSRSELKELRSDAAHRVDAAVDALTPVLSEKATQSGIRLYHESFARFLQEAFVKHDDARVELLNRLISWLEKLGLFSDIRAFRHLLQLRIDARQHNQVLETVQPDFVLNSIANGFPASAIIENLAKAIHSAAEVGAWPGVSRYVEMSRSVETYQEERFETAMVGFADVVVSVLGADTLADRLLHDERLTMSARAGLRLCAALDIMGTIPPWREYLRVFAREQEDRSVRYGGSSERAVDLAWLRGELRLASIEDGAGASESHTALHDPGDGFSTVDWCQLARHLDQGRFAPADAVRAVLDTFGYSAVVALIDRLKHPGAYCLALAEAVAAGHVTGTTPDALHWARRAVKHGLPPGSACRALALGVEIGEIAPQTAKDERDRFLELTRTVKGRLAESETSQLDQWLDFCTVSARTDPIGLSAVEALLEGPGWYLCWLRFAVSLSIAETKPQHERSRLSLEALSILAEVSDPFAGEPRACDLYFIEDRIHATIRRSIDLLDEDAWVEALETLDRVSASISTTLKGALHGPLSRSALLHLAVETVPATRGDSIQDLLSSEVNTRGDGRHYADLAEFRLLAARLALRLGNQSAVEAHWVGACRLLTAYGWRKDITIFDLLDPLSGLVAEDPARGRLAVARVQALCERIPLHTDGTETHHAPVRWWRLLAAADPCALSRLVLPSLLGSCNDPNRRLHEARAELWRTWSDQTDPVVGAALRLTLEKPLEETDPDYLARFASLAVEPGAWSSPPFLGELLARMDERPSSYGSSNDSGRLKRDAELLDIINAVATRVGGPRVGPLVGLPSDPGRAASPRNRLKETSTGQGISESVSGSYARFEPGPVGLGQAVRAWRDRPYGGSDEVWSVDRFSNIMGYRLAELLPKADPETLEVHIRAIADSVGFDDREGLLKALGHGLELLKQERLAAVAHTLAWTRGRGDGWTAFGGMVEIESLRRAVQLHRDAALRTLAGEVERRVSGGLGTWGITQALVQAGVLGCLDVSTDVAFSIWNAAFEAISDRAPRVAESDDPAAVYTVPEPDPGTKSVGDVNAAFAAAALAGLSHPGREQKRRALLAAKLLIEHRATLAAPAFASALASLSDPATLTWLLRLIELAGEKAKPVVLESRATLVKLANGPHLTVRALARRLLPVDEAPLAPVSRPDRSLHQHLSGGFVIPRSNGTATEVVPRARRFLRGVAGARLRRGERMVPGLQRAVYERLVTSVTSDEHEVRLQEQHDAYADQDGERMPNIFSVSHEAVEEAIQLAAAGARGARLMNGESIGDPAELEDLLAQALLDDPRLPLALELTRRPRPELPSPPPRDGAVWTDLKREGVTARTLRVLPAEALAELAGGPLDGWRLVASLERRYLPPESWEGKKYDTAERYRILELRVPGDQQGLTWPPISQDIFWRWGASSLPFAPLQEPTRSQPLVGCDAGVQTPGDAYYGLGIEVDLLTPGRWLLTALRAKDCTDFVVADGSGPALALVTWRTEYETSDHYLPWPRLLGSGLAIRSDLFECLLRSAGSKLVVRDFVAGSDGLFG